MTEKIYEFLDKYNRKDIYPFHMPGHKRNKEFLNLDYVNYDITEINGADNMNDARGVIRDAMKRTAELYGADRSFFLVNGSTAGIEASIMSVCADGDEILLARNSHRSAYSGLILSGAKPRYIFPELTEYSIPGGITPEAVEAELAAYPEIKAVFITSPTFEGFCSDVREISRVVHKHNKLLIVDNAHGAHFGFDAYFPESAVHSGADFVIQSMHKTLPALTQCSLLHVSDRIDQEVAARILSYLQTSSPSYVFMASIEKCLDILERQPNEALLRYIDILEVFRKDLSGCRKINLIGREIIGKNGIVDIDPAKLVFYINSEDMTGSQFEAVIREKFRAQVEMSGLNHVVAMTSFADTDYGMERLARAVLETDAKLSFSLKEGVNNGQANIYGQCPEQLITPREALHRSRKKIKLSEACGMASADFIIPYPPGIPVIAPGEKINSDIIDGISQFIKNGISVIGVDADSISVL